MTGPRLSVDRRIVFQGLGALGVAAALAGCGGDDGDPAADVPSGEELATTAEVPVGGGIVLTDQKLVITQPAEGEFKAFTAVCTHRGCTVAGVTDTIDCTCHGSSFDLESGEPLAGPATSPLAAVAIDVDGDRIVAA